MNMHNPIMRETILKVLREQSKTDDQMKTAGEIFGSVQETSLDWESILQSEDSGNDNDGYFPDDLVLIASLDWCKGSWHNQSPRLGSHRGDR